MSAAVLPPFLAESTPLENWLMDADAAPPEHLAAVLLDAAERIRLLTRRNNELLYAPFNREQRQARAVAAALAMSGVIAATKPLFAQG